MNINIEQEELISFLRGISDFFNNHTDKDGRNICFKHGVEHTGKTAYSIGIDLHLYSITGDAKYKQRAIQRALRIAHLLKEKDGCFFFTSDGSEKWNMSNHIIDSGAASDMLALVLQKKLLAPEAEDVVRQALYKNCDTYLVQTVTEKAHTNQRLWGAAGLSAGYAIAKKEHWKDAVLASVAMSAAEIRPDGSIPYVTDYSANDIHPSIADTTPYYHSRHIAFMWYALENIGALHKGDYLESMRRATDFLIGMFQQDGVKNMQLETKRWYFLSAYEVASHSYDVVAFFKMYEYTKDPKYAYYGNIALGQLLRHRVRSDSGIDDHIGTGTNFQCPYFWNSHCVWLLQIMDIIDAVDQKAVQKAPEQTLVYKDASLINVARKRYACIIRGDKKSRNAIWGPRIGGGSLLYFGLADNGFENILSSNELDKAIPLNFYTRRIARSFSELFPTSWSELRRFAFYVLVELRARNPRAAFDRLVILLRHSCSPFVYYSSQNCIKVTINQVGTNTFTFESSLAKEDGTNLSNCCLTRKYQLGEDALRVSEKLILKKRTPRVSYVINRCVKNLSYHSDGAIQVSDKKMTISGAAQITISYEL